MVNNKDPYPVCLTQNLLVPSTASRCLLICVNSLPDASKPPTCLKMVPEGFIFKSGSKVMLTAPGVTWSDPLIIRDPKELPEDSAL